MDDSIVRGNTMRQLVAMLFEGGAAEVHVRVSSPPVVSPCFYGIDMADEDELAAAHRSVEQMRETVGATSLHYLSLEGMQEATPARGLGLPRLLHAPAAPPGARAEPRPGPSARRRARRGDLRVAGPGKPGPYAPPSAEVAPVPLRELAATAVRGETKHVEVLEDLAVRVRRPTDGNRAIALDDERPVLRLPGAGLVRLLQPVGDDRLPAADRLTDRVVRVDGVLGEERADRGRVSVRQASTYASSHRCTSSCVIAGDITPRPRRAATRPGCPSGRGCPVQRSRSRSRRRGP